MNKAFFAAGILTCVSLYSFAQTSPNVNPCKTDYYHRKALAENPAYKLEEQRFNEYAEQYANAKSKTSRAIYIVPVVFHVIHTNGKENISKEQITDQMRVLNEDFRKMAGTPGGGNALAVDCEVEFRLANKDPNGNPFEGVNRVYSSLTNDAGDNVKTLIPSAWRTGKYFNIYVVNTIADDGSGTGIILGYAQFPFFGNSNTRGVVIRADCVGSIGLASASSQNHGGRVLTHEIGHCFGLYHTFQDGCVSSPTGGDKVADTPPAAAANFGSCTSVKNTCPSQAGDDQLQNYMDYTDGACKNIFTAGQKTRMDANINSYYNTTAYPLVTTANLTVTGVQGYTVPASGIAAPGGQSFEANNVIDISSSNQDWMTKNNGNNVFNNWVIENQTSSTHGWRVSDSAFHDGAKCLYLPLSAHPTNTVKFTYNFYSPVLNLSSMSSAYLNFYAAYAQRIGSFSDSLNVYVSNNYGLSWTPLSKLGGSSLATSAPIATGVFVPNSSQWRAYSLNLAGYRTSSVRLRFECVYNRGNNMYLDEISINNQILLGTDDAPVMNGLSVYPNPASSDAQVAFVLGSSTKVKAGLFNLMGQQLGHIDLGALTQGEHNFRISEMNTGTLPQGVYLVKLTAGNQQHISKLVISR